MVLLFFADALIHTLNRVTAALLMLSVLSADGDVVADAIAVAAVAGAEVEVEVSHSPHEIMYIEWCAFAS